MTEGEQMERGQVDKEQIQELISAAMAQLERAYAPYSHFKVGRPCSQRRAGYTQGATLKMPPTRPPTAGEDRFFQGG